MDIIGGLIQEVATIVGYLLLFTGVYKLFQILTVLGEIKDLLKSQTGTVPPLPVPGAKAALLTDAHSADDAAQYAEKLLRAVNAESHPVPAGGSADLERS